MTLFKRSPRRMITTLVAAGALAAAAIVVPSLAAPAFASDTSTAKSLFSDLNTQRQSNSVVALKADGYLISGAQKLAKSYAGSHHPCPTNNVSAPNDSHNDAPIVNTVVCTSVSVGSHESARLNSSFFALPNPDNNVYNAFTNYVGVGVYTKGSHVYAVLSLLGYNDSADQEISFGKPWITGTPKVGHQLVAHFPVAVLDDGFSTGNPTYTTNWEANGTTIATNTELYTVQPNDADKKIIASVVVSKSGFGSVTSDSSASAKVALGTFTFSSTKRTIIQVISGLTPYGTVSTPNTPPTFQWYLGTHAISGATGILFDPTNADIGHQLKVKATYASLNYKTVVLTYETSSQFAGLRFISTRFRLWTTRARHRKLVRRSPATARGGVRMQPSPIRGRRMVQRSAASTARVSL